MLKSPINDMAAKSAKSNEEWIPFRLHALDTALTMGYLLHSWLPQNIIRQIHAEDSHDFAEQICVFLAMTHDIGKLTRLFQYRISHSIPGHLARLNSHGMLNGCIRFLYPDQCTHARAGQAILERCGCPVGIACIVGSHHGKPLDNSIDEDELEQTANYSGYDTAEKDIWENTWREWISFALDYAGFSSMEELPQLSITGQMLASGLLIMADWIASNQTYFPPIAIDHNLTDDECAIRAECAWQALQLPDYWDGQCFSMTSENFEDRFHFPPNMVQQTLLSVIQEAAEPGLLILEAQMGVGKTEAALAAAEYLNTQRQCGGLFFGLPTQATANGIFERLLSWAEKQTQDSILAIRLAHASAALNDEYATLFHGTAQISEDVSGLHVHPWFEGNKQALLSNFVIGTVDQLLMAALKQKHVMLRHLGLAGKVVIIDECHAYDAYMSTYLERALRWLGSYGCPVILLSATLPATRRAAFVEAYLGASAPGAWQKNIEYPLLTWTDTAQSNPVQQVRIGVDTPQKTVIITMAQLGTIKTMLKSKLSQGGCAGVIVNTVNRAQEAASLLQTAMPECEVLLYHAQFLMPDRAEKESELLHRVGKHSAQQSRNKLIVVGTQVLEQSLDLDFDMLVTDLCPMDLLLQRIGRLHRHNRVRPDPLAKPHCVVLQEEDGGMDKGSIAVYGEWLLERTKEFLQEEIVLPGDIPKLVQAVYADPEEETAAWMKYRDEQQKKRTNADVYCIAPPTHSRRRAPTLTGLLRNEASKSAKAEAAVRDGDPSLDVIVLQQWEDGAVHFLPWQNGGMEIFVDEVPNTELARKIATQRLRLPHRFCTPWHIDKTIAELEAISGFSAELQKSPWLHGELFLLLDAEQNCTLLNEIIHYDKEKGLQKIGVIDNNGT